MKLAIMQPYFFPYLGYFKLIEEADVFVFYDDVNYIKQGWINRNKLPTKNNDFYFTVPLKGQSSFKNINQVTIDTQMFKHWREKFIRTITQMYGKAPYFNEVIPIIMEILACDHTSISVLAKKSVVELCRYLQIKTTMISSSQQFNNEELKGQNRIIDICAQTNATSYLNLPGGRALYTDAQFKENNIELHFLETHHIENQYSILDPIMTMSKEKIRRVI